MFIRSVSSGGGYRGDVNTSFRQGRQDAFRDYIDNFNFALAADARNNAENQRQVERVARNYGLGLGMDNAARQDALNFVQGSANIDNAIADAGINFQRNAYLKAPETQSELGKAQASTVVAGTQQKAVDANTGLSNSEFTQSQLPVTQQTTAVNNQAGLVNANRGLTVANVYNMGAEAQELMTNTVNNITDDEVRTEFIKNYRKANPNSMKTDAALMAEADKDLPALREQLALERVSPQLLTMQSAQGTLQPNGSNTNFNFAPTKDGGVAKPSQTRTQQNSNEPYVSKVGKTTTLSVTDFEKDGKPISIPGYPGVFRHKEGIAVMDKTGQYRYFEPNEITTGRAKTVESDAELIQRALREMGREITTDENGNVKPNTPETMK